jgi:hypothetical protein
VRIALNGFDKQWNVFVKCVVGREQLPTWERLGNDFIQEEIRKGSQHGDKKKTDDEENLALASKKGKGKKRSIEGASSKGGKKKLDMTKVKCYVCH